MTKQTQRLTGDIDALPERGGAENRDIRLSPEALRQLLRRAIPPLRKHRNAPILQWARDRPRHVAEQGMRREQHQSATARSLDDVDQRALQHVAIVGVGWLRRVIGQIEQDR